MRVDIQQVRQEPVTLEVELPASYLMEDLEEGLTLEDATGHATFRMAGEDLIATGTLHTRLQGPCARCLAPARRDIQIDFQLNYWPETGNEASKIVDVDPDEPDYATYRGTTIHPDDDLRQLILVEIPDVLLCREACHGLCPRCGADLNRGPCPCPQEDNDADEAPEPDETPEWKKKLRDLRLD